MSSCFAQLANALVPRACKSHPWSWLNKAHCSFQPDTGSSKWQEGGKQALSHGHYRWVQANRRPQFTTCQEHVAWGQGSLPRCTPLAVPRAPARLLAEVPACSWIFSCPQSLSTLPHLFSGHRWRKIGLNHVPFIEYIVFPSVIYSKCHNCHFKKIFIFRRSYFHTCNLYIIYHLQQHNPAFQKQRVLLLQQKFKSVPCKFRQLPYLPKHTERRFIFVKHSAFWKVWIMWGDC